MQKIRYYEIDLLRFIAASFVVVYHYTFRGYAADDLSPLYFPYMSVIFKYGYLGVDLFFMISGFVILLTAEKKTAKEFVVSRIVRLYPAFWICVSITALTILCYGEALFTHISLTQYLTNLTMLHSFLKIPSVDGVYWTLVVEMRFYFWIFILLLLRKMEKIRLFYLIALSISGLHLLQEQTYLKHLFFPEFFPYFVTGSICYLIQKQGIKVFDIALLLLAYLLSNLHAFHLADEISIRYNTEINKAIVYSIISCFHLLFIAIAANKLHFLRSPHLFHLGIITYPLYLLHQNIGFIVFNQLEELCDKYVLLWGTVLLMLFISWGVYWYGERPIAKIIKRILQKVLSR